MAWQGFNFLINIFLQYLPSRLLVILNSIIIIPFYMYILTTREMGLYQIVIGLLNLLCTCSTDWITKSALRFYEKYKLQNKLSEFYSNIVFVFLIVYMFIIFLYFTFADFVYLKFFIPKDVLALTIILIIPCGLRQFLYQLLRIFNKPFLYTFSVLIYQISHLLLFLCLFNILDNVVSILVAMITAMFLIDLYIIKLIRFNLSLKFSIDFQLIREALQYSLPTIFTNSSIWVILHINKFVFQNFKMFDYTAVVGTSWSYTTYILTPLFSTLLFAIFPLIIKKYENKKSIKNIVTKAVQLYFNLFIPLTFLFVFYSKEITNTLFDLKYKQAYIIMPFIALTIFLHELMKILNIKYHLKNQTYIEMLLTVLTGIVCVILNLKLIPEYNLLGAGIAMLCSMTFLITANSCVIYKDLKFITTSKIYGTLFKVVILGILTMLFVNGLLFNAKYQILKPILFIFVFYAILYIKRFVKKQVDA